MRFFIFFFPFGAGFSSWSMLWSFQVCIGEHLHLHRHLQPQLKLGTTFKARQCDLTDIKQTGRPFFWLLYLLSSLNAHDHAHSATHTKKKKKKATSLLLPSLCCLSVFLSHLSSLKQRNQFQFHVFIPFLYLLIFFHPLLSILISGNQSAVNNLLNSIDRHHLVSWPAT